MATSIDEQLADLDLQKKKLKELQRAEWAEKLAACEEKYANDLEKVAGAEALVRKAKQEAQSALLAVNSLKRKLGQPVRPRRSKGEGKGGGDDE